MLRHQKHHRLPFCTPMFFPISLYCAPVIFVSFLKKYYKMLRCGLSIISRMSSMTVKELSIELSDQHLNGCEHFSRKILSFSMHSRHDYFSKYNSHIASRSAFRFMPSGIISYWNSNRLLFSLHPDKPRPFDPLPIAMVFVTSWLVVLETLVALKLVLLPMKYDIIAQLTITKA